jgi:hypothetical protein
VRSFIVGLGTWLGIGLYSALEWFHSYSLYSILISSHTNIIFSSKLTLKTMHCTHCYTRREYGWIRVIKLDP